MASMQAPNYTPGTDFSDDEANNTGGRSTVRTDRVDAEYQNISTSINALVQNLALIQRDDGKLVDGLIEPYNFSAASKAFVLATKWNARGLWAASMVFAVNDLVDMNGAAYVCAVAHTSTDFASDYAAGRWQIFTTASEAAAIAFSSTANIVANDVQSAIVEVDTNARSGFLPILSALYGGM